MTGFLVVTGKVRELTASTPKISRCTSSDSSTNTYCLCHIVMCIINKLTGGARS